MSDLPGLLSPEHRTLSIAIYTTIALVAFEGTSVAAALPELAADLGDVGILPWVITGYLFALGISTVVAGPLVDALGARAIFPWSAAAFAGTGFAAGLVNDLTALVVIRFAQGAASGVLFAAAIAAVNLGFPSSLTGRAFAANSVVWGLMGAAAPAIAAGMLAVASWRWIFFVNLPLGALAILAGRGRMPDRQAGAEPLSIDGRGAVLAALFTLGSIMAVDSLGWSSLGWGALCVGAIGLYVLHARRTARPVLSLRHIAVEPYRSLALVPALMLAAAFTTNLYVTVYVAAGRGWSSGAAAWSVLFFTIGWTIGATISSRLLDRVHAVTVMAGGLVTSTLGLVVIVIAVGVDAPLVLVFGGLLTVGIGIGLTTNASLFMLRIETPPETIGRASAANQFARSQGFVLGSAAGGAILLFVVNREIGSVEVVRSLLSGDAVDGGPEIAAAVRSGFGWVTTVALVVIVVAVAPMLQLVQFRRRQSASVDQPAAGSAATWRR